MPSWSEVLRPAVAAAFLLTASAPRQAVQAQWLVECPTCAGAITQLQSYAQEAASLAEQITMRITQAQQLKYQIQNTVGMPQAVWQNIQGNFASTQGLFNRGSQLALNAGMVSSQLQTYRGYLGQVVDMPTQYQRWSTQSNDAVTATLSSLGLQRDQMRTDQQIVDAIRTRSSGTDGAVRAIQVNTEMAGAQVNELHRLREIMLADAQLNANHLQIQADRDAMGQAQRDNFFATPAPSMTGNRRY